LRAHRSGRVSLRDLLCSPCFPHSTLLDPSADAAGAQQDAVAASSGLTRACGGAGCACGGPQVVERAQGWLRLAGAWLAERLRRAASDRACARAQSGLTAALCVAFPASLTRNELRDAFEARRAALLCLPRLPAPAPPPSQEGACGLATLAAQRQGAAGTQQAHAAQAAAAAPVPPPVAQAERRAEADACWLAVCGWRCDARAAAQRSSTAHPSAAEQGRLDASQRSLRCDACGACVGLWNLAVGRPPPGSPAYAHAAAAARLASLSLPSRAATSSSELVNVTALAYAAQPRTTMLRTIAGGAPASAVAAQEDHPSGAFGAKRRRTDDGAGVCDADCGLFAAAAALQPQEGLSQAGLPLFDALSAHRPACPWACAWPAAAEPDAPPPPKGCAAGWMRTLRAVLPEDAAASQASTADAHTHTASQAVHAPPRTRTAADAREVVRQLLAGKT